MSTSDPVLWAMPRRELLDLLDTTGDNAPRPRLRATVDDRLRRCPSKVPRAEDSAAADSAA